MATVNEKMTELANAIRSKTGGTGALSIDGMISAVNGISTGGGTTTYQLWGSHSVLPNDFDAGNLAGTYTIPANYMYSLFYSYDESRWVYTQVTQIEVFSNGNIEVTGYNGVWKYYAYDEGIWYDEEDRTDDRLRFYNIPNPIAVSKNLYDLFFKIYDNGEAYMNAYDIGYKIGAKEGIEALGALCDWTAMVDSNSNLIMTLINYHPTYYMVCDIFYDGDMYTDFVVLPSDSSSIDWMADFGSSTFDSTDMSFGVENVRWMANEP